MGSGWTHLVWENEEQVRASFTKYAETGAPNLGLILGENSGGLVDVDIDHPKAARFRDILLPPSPMNSGRIGRPRSHRWFIAEGEVPQTRQYKLPSGEVLIELRSTGSQTVIPPSTWYPRDWDGNPKSTQKYRWEGKPWGGKEGPRHVDGATLAVQVALCGLGAVLLDAWPRQGSRHSAYLALAGGLLRLGDGVHPYWERNLPVLIRALADATDDEDGGVQRVKEVMATTLGRLREGDKAVGFGTLAEIIGNDHAEQARRYARDIEVMAGFVGRTSPAPIAPAPGLPPAETSTLTGPNATSDGSPTGVGTYAHEQLTSTLDPIHRNPLEERINTWAVVDIDPYLTGEVQLPEANVLEREDGKGLFYEGCVNSLFGMSESGKSWCAMWAAVGEIGKGNRVMFIDFEDMPLTALTRMRMLGAGDEDLRRQFRYVHPEEPTAEMQRGKFGSQVTAQGQAASSVFRNALEKFDPTLVIVDGMTVLYGLHGHDTNDASGSDVVTSWLKSITRNGRTAVIVIDHTGKNGGPGASPIGAHHKIAMIQGTAIRAEAISRPMPGGVGVIDLIVFKDRHGEVRANSSKPQGREEQHAAKMTLDFTQKGLCRVRVEAPDDPNPKPTAEKKSPMQKTKEAIIALFAEDESRVLKTPEVMMRTNMDRQTVYDAWVELVEEGLVVREGKTASTRYRLRLEAGGEDL